MKYIPLSIAILFFTCKFSFSQELFKTVRGTVVDKLSREPLTGASVVLLDSSKTNGAFCDVDGKFRLQNVPLGRQMLRISFLGYKETTLSIVVTSGKEVV